jgi:hypothetical protein
MTTQQLGSNALKKHSICGFFSFFCNSYGYYFQMNLILFIYFSHYMSIEQVFNAFFLNFKKYLKKIHNDFFKINYLIII